MPQAQERRAEAPAAMWVARPPSAGSLEEIKQLRALAKARRAASLQAFCQRLGVRAEYREKVRKTLPGTGERVADTPGGSIGRRLKTGLVPHCVERREPVDQAFPEKTVRLEGGTLAIGGVEARRSRAERVDGNEGRRPWSTATDQRLAT